jgi:exopolysaccharide biosynthesis polyprenyl glycosylphosphotransferase
MTTTEAVVPPRRGDGDGRPAASSTVAEPHARAELRPEVSRAPRPEEFPIEPGTGADAEPPYLVRPLHQLRELPPLPEDPAPASASPPNRRVTDPADPMVLRGPVYDPFSARRRPWPEWLVSYTARLVGWDAVCAFAAAWTAAAVVPDATATLGGTAALAVAWCAVVLAFGGYAERHLGTGADEYRQIGMAGLVTVAALGVVHAVAPGAEVRALLLAGAPAATLLTLAARNVLRRGLQRARRRGYMRKQVVLVGRSAAVLDLAQRLRRDPDAGYEVLGACVPAPDDAAALREGDVAVLGGLEHVPQVLDNVRADAVVVASASETAAEYLRRLAWQLEGTKIEVLVAPGLIEAAPDRLRVRPTKSVPLLHLREPEYRGQRRLVKTLFDRLLAAGLLLVSAPVFLGIALLVALDSRGPVLYRHRRIGKRGREFDLLKFRSMRVGADAQIDALAELNEGNDVQFKMRRDPRVTRVGQILRRYSLDELPQLINVVKGDMSLVGPRPHVTREVEQYGDDMHRRLLVKPGITGLWQVSGRSDLSWAESVELDVRYVDNWSLGRDLAILWRTARAVLRGSGAY